MATEKKVGVLVKEARTAASLTQEKLAAQAGEGLTANDISKCEQQKADLTTAQLKAIAKVCKVTQTSLVNAPKNLSTAAAKKATTTAVKKPATATAKKPAATAAAKKTTTTTAKKPATTAAKKPATTAAAKKPAVPAAANISMKVTSTEQKLVETYRGASSDSKKLALKILKGEINDNVLGLLGSVTGTSTSASDGLADVLTNAISGFFGKK